MLKAIRQLFEGGKPAPAAEPVNEHAFAHGVAYPFARRRRDPGWRVWKRFRECSTISEDCMLGSMAWCTGTPRQIHLGARTICRGILLCDGGLGSIDIGEFVYIGDDVVISTRDRIWIGSRTLVAHGVQIFDNDSHPVDARDRHADYLNLLGGRARTHDIPARPVVIGEDCWIGTNSIVLKGVTIGNRSVVAAGSVVTADVGEDCVVAGNPARVVRSLV
jgi:acetyltransferase-like isoleucine patch superfamily enzyme